MPVIPDSIVGIHEAASVGLRVRRRGHWNRATGDGGTIIQLAANGRLAYVRWDDPDEADLSGAAGGYEMFPTGYFGGHALALLTPRPWSAISPSHGGKGARRLSGAMILGRDCQVMKLS